MDFEKLKEAFQISKNESVIVTFRVPLNLNDRVLPFGKFNINILDDVNYDLFAEVQVKLKKVKSEKMSCEESAILFLQITITSHTLQNNTFFKIYRSKINRSRIRSGKIFLTSIFL